MWHPQTHRPTFLTEGQEIDWVLGIARGLGGDYATGNTVRRRILQTVKSIASVDETLGSLTKAEDAVLVLDAAASAKTSPEALPFLDCVLLTFPGKPDIAITAAGGLKSLGILLQEYPLDRPLMVRVLALAKLVDEEALAGSEGLDLFSNACKALMENTIDPAIRQHATETYYYVDAVNSATKLANAVSLLSGEELLSFRASGALCLKCDSGTHAECEKQVEVCVNCRGARILCLRGCKDACRACGISHAWKGLAECLDESIRKRKAPENEVPDCTLEEEREAKKLRSVRAYKESKKRAKEEKRTAAYQEDHRIPAAESFEDFKGFEKLLKDTVAALCFRAYGDSGAEVPEWRKVYRTISSLLLEKESRMAPEFRYRVGTEHDKAAVVKRVSGFTKDWICKHQASHQ